MNKTILKIAVLLAIVCFAIWWAAGPSPSLQACIHDHKRDDAYKALYAYPPGLPHVRARVRLNVACVGVFIDKNGGAITAIATIVIAIFTGVLWKVTGQQVRVTKEALIADKRAFVFPKDILPEWSQDPTTGQYVWRFRPQWENSGDTPTKNMRLYSACELRTTLLPNGFDFDQVISPPGTGLCPPKTFKLGGAAPLLSLPAITPQDILDIQAQRKYLYVWGWVRYFDVFPGTPEHITRFCWQILPRGNPLTFTPGQLPANVGSLSFPSIHHIEGNCADEECDI